MSTTRVVRVRSSGAEARSTTGVTPKHNGKSKAYSMSCRDAGGHSASAVPRLGSASASAAAREVRQMWADRSLPKMGATVIDEDEAGGSRTTAARIWRRGRGRRAARCITRAQLGQTSAAVRYPARGGGGRARAAGGRVGGAGSMGGVRGRRLGARRLKILVRKWRGEWQRRA